MGLQLRDYSRFETGEIDIEEVQRLISETPTSEENLQKQMQGFEKLYGEIQAEVLGESGNQIQLSKTLKGKLQLYVLEPNISPEQKAKAEEIIEYLNTNEVAIARVVEEVSRKANSVIDEDQD